MFRAIFLYKEHLCNNGRVRTSKTTTQHLSSYRRHDSFNVRSGSPGSKIARDNRIRTCHSSNVNTACPICSITTDVDLTVCSIWLVCSKFRIQTIPTRLNTRSRICTWKLGYSGCARVVKRVQVVPPFAVDIRFRVCRGALCHPRSR
jgi:hypothetical protein